MGSNNLPPSKFCHEGAYAGSNDCEYRDKYFCRKYGCKLEYSSQRFGVKIHKNFKCIKENKR